MYTNETLSITPTMGYTNTLPTLYEGQTVLLKHTVQLVSPEGERIELVPGTVAKRLDNLVYTYAHHIKLVTEDGLEFMEHRANVTPLYNNYLRPIHANTEDLAEVTFVHVEPTIVYSFLNELYSLFQGTGYPTIYVAGEFAAHIALGDLANKPDNINIFVENPKSWDDNNINTVLDRFKELGFTATVETPYSITLTPSDSDYCRRFLQMGMPARVELIKPMMLSNGETFGFPEQIADSFMFTVHRAVIVDTRNAFVDKELEADTASKTLNVRNINNLSRLNKTAARLMNRGFKPNDSYAYIVGNYTRALTTEEYLEQFEVPSLEQVEVATVKA